MAGGFDIQSLQKRMFSAAILIPAVLLFVFIGGTPLFLIIALLILLCLYEAFSMARQTSRPVLYGAVLFSYILLSGYFLMQLAQEHYFFGFLMLFMVWAGDIGAYFSGKIIGGTKMAPSVSPNKTWAGFFGAGFFAFLVSVVALFINPSFALGSGFWALSFSGALIAWTGQAGDLFISFIKRKANLKDTGHIIPGHGGLLDRVDSMLLAGPVFFILLSALVAANVL